MKKLTQILVAILITAIFMILAAKLIGSPDAYAAEFEREISIREDERYSSMCSWDYGDQKIIWNVQLGICFEDHSAVGDSGFRYEDGSARWEYLEFVGMRNADRSINEWVVIDNAERKKVWKERQEELKALRTDREQVKIKEEISSMKKEIEALMEKLLNL